MKPKILGAPEYLVIDRDSWRGHASRQWKDYARPWQRAFKLRRASKPRPGDVFLVLGDIDGDVRFEDPAEVSWAADRVFDSDLCYRPVRWR